MPLSDQQCTYLKARRIHGDVGIFPNISREIAEVKSLIRAPPPEPTVQARDMAAFAIGTQVASAKYVGSPPEPLYYDTRLFEGAYPWLFSKGLIHDAKGFAPKEALDALMTVIRSDGEGIEDLKQYLGSSQKLIGLQTCNSYWVLGSDPHRFSALPGYVQGDSTTNVCEMLEVYEKALHRDISFKTIAAGTSPETQRALATMNAYLDVYRGPKPITPQSLFRGLGVDELKGPYVSQFLVQPLSLNGASVAQKYPVELDSKDSIQKAHFLDIQRGIIQGPPNFSGDKKYIYSPRVLGSYVHNDPMYSAYFNAALIMYQNGFEFAHSGLSASTAWTDFGAPDGLATLAHAALGALRVAWYNKWYNFLKLRPEMMAYRIEQILEGELTGFPLDIRGQTVAHVRATQGNALLMLQYPEGSPRHPSFPAGHAVVAGACVTVLKAFMKTHTSDGKALAWPLDALESLDGSSLSTTDKTGMTIVGELNKLASNIAIGRNMAGVHYRQDGDDGIRVGEAFAIEYLRTKLREYATVQLGLEQGWRLQKFNGDFINITL